MTALARPPDLTRCAYCHLLTATTVCPACKRDKINGAARGSVAIAGSAPVVTPEAPASAPPLNADPQELPAVTSASRQDDSTSSNPGTVGRSDFRPTKADEILARDSAQYPAESAPLNAVREADARPVAAEACTFDQRGELSMTRQEHLQWCKNRALEYLNAGDNNQALASMLSDLGKHPETQGAAVSCGPIAVGLLMSGQLSTREQMKKFIEGFN
jgi:hypothetical protein